MRSLPATQDRNVATRSIRPSRPQVKYSRLGPATTDCQSQATLLAFFNAPFHTRQEEAAHDRDDGVELITTIHRQNNEKPDLLAETGLRRKACCRGRSA